MANSNTTRSNKERPPIVRGSAEDLLAASSRTFWAKIATTDGPMGKGNSPSLKVLAHVQCPPYGQNADHHTWVTIETVNWRPDEQYLDWISIFENKYGLVEAVGLELGQYGWSAQKFILDRFFADRIDLAQPPPPQPPAPVESEQAPEVQAGESDLGEEFP